METIAKKRCGKCKAVKPVGEFHRNNSTKDGYQGRCKACHAITSCGSWQRRAEQERRENERYLIAHQRMAGL